MPSNLARQGGPTPKGRRPKKGGVAEVARKAENEADASASAEGKHAACTGRGKRREGKESKGRQPQGPHNPNIKPPNSKRDARL